MKQAALIDGFAFDPLPFQRNDLAAPEVEVGGVRLSKLARGVRVHGTRIVTKRPLDVFDTDAGLRREFLSSIGM